jgi:hypothetical protein
VQVADRAVQPLGEVVDEQLAVLRRGEAGHVAADAEGAALRAQQHDADIVGPGPAHGAEQLAAQPRVQRVAPVALGERDAREPAGVLVATAAPGSGWSTWVPAMAPPGVARVSTVGHGDRRADCPLVQQVGRSRRRF